MPVADHPVHASTVKAHGSLNGCHNAERTAGYWAPDGYKVAQAAEGSGVMMPKMRWITDVMSTKCKYDRRHADPGCLGCLK